MNQNYRLEMDRLQAHLSDQERMLAGQIVRNVMRLVSQSQQFMEALGVALESSNRIARASLDMVNPTSLEVTKEDEDIVPAVQAGGGRHVKPATIHYRVARTSGRVIVTCTLGGPCDSGTRVINPGPSQQICNDSPTGFEFGYPGSGRRSLPWPSCSTSRSRAMAPRLYQAFKFDFVAPLDEWQCRDRRADDLQLDRENAKRDFPSGARKRPTEAQVRSSLAPHVEGMFLAAASLVMLMDHEDMTLEKLRGVRRRPSSSVTDLAFRHGIEDAIGSLPENMFPPEEKRMLEY